MPIRTYLINHQTEKKCRLNGIIPSIQLPSEENLRQSFSDYIVYDENELPPKVDLRSTMTPVENQSRIGSCTANALAGAYEYLLKKGNGMHVDVSRLFIYYNARAKKKPYGYLTDTGCSMTNAIEALAEFGTCLESIWSYDISRVNTRPDDRAYEQAQNYQITGASKLDINLNEMKLCLAQGFPFAFGLRLYRSFDRAARTGVVPMPDETEQGRTEHGRHALLAVGYSDQSQAFIVRNSWGDDWADQGYCFIPYGYMSNPNLCFDAWTIHQLENYDMGQDHWDRTDDIDYQSMAQAFDVNGDDCEILQIEEDDFDENIYQSNIDCKD